MLDKVVMGFIIQGKISSYYTVGESIIGTLQKCALKSAPCL